MKDSYQYRDKVNGHWISEPVSRERILELVTRGTLTPYDFVKGDKPESLMIRDLWEDNTAQEHWAMLRKIRLDLNRLWEAQLDSLMSKITNPDAKVQRSSFTMPEAEPSFDKFRSKESSTGLKEKLEKECLNFWNDDVDVLIENSPPKKILQKAIIHGIKADCLDRPNKYTLEGLHAVDDLDQVAYMAKRKVIEDWLCSSGFLNEWGVYIFYDNEKPLYVGETGLRKTRTDNWNNGTFYKRFFEGNRAHFTREIPSSNNDKKWSLLCTKIRFIRLNTHGRGDDSINKIMSQEMERLLILKYGLTDLKNDMPGTKNGPIDDVLSELESEIDGLCDDGELLKKDVEIEHLKSQLPDSSN